MDHPPRACRPIRSPGQDAGRVGVKRNWAALRQVRRHVRYLLSDVIDWEKNDSPRTSATQPNYYGLMLARSDELGGETAAARRGED